MRCFLISLLFVFLCTPVYAQTQITESVDIPNSVPAFNGMSALDIAYAPYGGALTALDIYTPDKTTQSHVSRPVIFYVHGGWWRSGDKSDVGAKPAAFTAAGYVFVSVNYRLSPKVGYPGFMDDLAVALYWVKNNIRFYGGDPKRVALMGHSTSAQLVSLLGIMPEYLKVATMTRNEICGIIGIDSSSYDLVNTPPPAKGTVNYVEQVFGKDHDILKEASPITYFKSYNEKFPPFLLTYVSNEQETELASTNFYNAIRRIGSDAELVPGSGYTHFTINSYMGRPDDPVTAHVMRFIDTHCGKPK